MHEIDPAAFSRFPDGFWRRIELHPAPGRITAGLEDNVHRFHVALHHADGIVTDVAVETPRVPASTCPGAGPYIVAEMVGLSLSDISTLTAADHCTHLRDLAILAASHALDVTPKRFDMWVADRIEDRTTALLVAEGEVKLRWELDGTEIRSPSALQGRSLKAFSKWVDELDPREAELAGLLRRAVMVSGARRASREVVMRPADFVRARMGACYTYHPDRAFKAVRTADWLKDFGRIGETPLSGFAFTGDAH